MAFLNKGLTIVLRDERPGQGKAETGLADEIPLAEAAPTPGAEDEAFEATEITYRYDGGLEDYVKHINAEEVPDPQVGGQLLRRRRRQERHAR